MIGWNILAFVAAASGAQSLVGAAVELHRRHSRA